MKLLALYLLKPWAPHCLVMGGSMGKGTQKSLGILWLRHPRTFQVGSGQGFPAWRPHGPLRRGCPVHQDAGRHPGCYPPEALAPLSEAGWPEMIPDVAKCSPGGQNHRFRVTFPQTWKLIGEPLLPAPGPAAASGQAAVPDGWVIFRSEGTQIAIKTRALSWEHSSACL